jgi:SET domain-containing protein 6
MYLQGLKRMKPGLFSGKRQRDEICNTVILHAVKVKLAQYPTTIAEDEALLKRQDLAKRYRMAVQVRIGEKKLLKEAIALLEDTGAESSNAEDKPTAKKLRTKK